MSFSGPYFLICKVILCYAVLYYKVGTGTITAGQTMAGFFPADLPNLVLFMLILCVFLFLACRVANYLVIQEHFLTAKM